MDPPPGFSNRVHLCHHLLKQKTFLQFLASHIDIFEKTTASIPLIGVILEFDFFLEIDTNVHTMPKMYTFVTFAFRKSSSPNVS
jgi:hypothetical protein